MRPALDIIAFTVKQGLAHPMQCLPVLVALETSPDPITIQKAFSLHSLVHTKHAALVNTRIGESVQAAYRYQRRLSKNNVATGWIGDPPVAHLARWYSLMREKRPWRLEFLKAIVRGLQVEADNQSCDQVSSVVVSRFTTADSYAGHNRACPLYGRESGDFRVQNAGGGFLRGSILHGHAIYGWDATCTLCNLRQPG